MKFQNMLGDISVTLATELSVENGYFMLYISPWFNVFRVTEHTILDFAIWYIFMTIYLKLVCIPDRKFDIPTILDIYYW